MPEVIEGQLLAEGMRFAIVSSRFNSFIVDRLIEGAIDTLTRLGADEKGITIVKVPGAWELPMAAQRVVDKGGFDAVICLGTIIRGGTPHFEYIAAETTKGLAAVGQKAPMPVVFGVLTCDTVDQAVDRAGTKHGNKGAEAALTAVEMANLYQKL